MSIPKIKKDERIKLIDVPELLVVVPLTHSASKRYGHKTRWCTSTSSDTQWNGNTKNAVLIYILMYNTVEGKRGSDAHTKVAIQRKSRAIKWQIFDTLDAQFDFSVLEWSLRQYDFRKLIDDYYSTKYKITSRKLFSHSFEVGDIVQGVGNNIIKIRFGKIKPRTKGRWHNGVGWKTKKVSIPDLQSECIFEIERRMITRAEITRVTLTNIKFRIIELKGAHEFAEILSQSDELELNVRASKNNYTLLE